MTGSTSIACAYPTGTGVIDLVSDGPLTWVDPRVVRDFRFWPHVSALALLMLGWLVWNWRVPEYRSAAFDGRFVLFRVAVATTSLAAALFVAEAALGALGDHAPGGIASSRSRPSAIRSLTR